MAVELIRAVEREFSVALYPTLLFEHPTLQAFERYLQQHLSEHADTESAQNATLPDVPHREHGSVSPETEAYVIDQRGDAVDLRRESRPVRALEPAEIGIEVEAWGVNFIDVLCSVGLHPVLRDPVFVPGHEVAGVVTHVGSAVRNIRRGDRVMALLGEGGYARRVVTSAHLAMTLPERMSASEGASMLVTGLTAVAVIEEAARLRSGESILIQSAAGATGMALVQLALHHGGTVFGTASRPEKLSRLRSMGVQHVIPYTQRDFEEAILEQTDGVDIVVDSLSGDAIRKGLRILRTGGRFIELGAGASVEVPPIDPAALFLANQSFIGVNLSQMMSNPDRLARLQDRLRVLMESGALKPLIGHKFGFSEVPEAMDLLRSRRSIGKIVLTA
jgi:myxalamid-type polyketide synthase MxaE and MxaD